MTWLWGEWGNAALHPRRMEARPADSPRRRCRCGCGQWAEWLGTAQGMCLTSGCELSVRRWVHGR